MSEENKNWLESLPEPLREAPFIGKAESIEDAVGKLAHAAKLVGTSIRIPGEDASDEDRAAFYEKLTSVQGVARLPTHDDQEGISELLTKLGKPEDHTGYKLPDDIDGFEWDEGIGESLRKYAFDANMTAKQFDIFARRIAEQEQGAHRETNQSKEDMRKELRLDWGDTLEDREAMIRGWMDKSGAPDELREQFENRDLDLKTMNWLHAIAKQFKGDVSPISKGQEGAPHMTPAEAREAIPKLLTDMKGMAQSDPRYADYQRRLVEAHRLAKPSTAA